MKKLLIILLILILLAVGVFVYAWMNASSLVNKYKPDLERVASQALGAPVTLGELDVSVFPSAAVHIGEFKIGQKEGEAFTLNNLVLKLRLRSLLSGILDIETLSLERPTIVVIKDRDGVNIAGLPKKKESSSSPAPSDKKAGSPASGGMPAGVGLNLQTFEVNDGTLTFKDLEAKKDYVISGINVHSGVGFGNNIAHVTGLAAQANILGKANLSINAPDISFDLGSGVATAEGVRAEVSGNPVAIDGKFDTKAQTGAFTVKSEGINLGNFAPLYEDFPAIKEMSLKGNIKPDLSGDLASGALKSRGTVTLSGIGASISGYTISDGSGVMKVSITPGSKEVTTDNLNIKVNGQPIAISLDAELDDKNRAVLRTSEIAAFSGKISAKGSAELGGSQQFSSAVQVRGIALGDALQVVSPAAAARFKGTLSQADANVTGTLGPTLKESLVGTASISAVNCTLMGVNIAGEILRAVNNLPFVPGSLYNSVPPELSAKVSSNDTQIKSVTGDFKIGDARLVIPNLHLESDLFSLASDGRIGFDSSMDMNSTVSFSPEFSKALAERTKEIKKILDTDGRLVIPLTFKGTPPKILVLPNVEKLIEIAARKALKDNAGNLLDKVLGGRKGGGSGKGLDKLFGF